MPSLETQTATTPSSKVLHTLPYKHTTPTHLTHTHTSYTSHTHTTYHTHKDARLHNYIPRLFELNSTTGEFVASEVLYPARTNDPEAFPFLQSDIYSTVQPGAVSSPLHHYSSQPQSHSIMAIPIPQLLI